QAPAGGAAERASRSAPPCGPGRRHRCRAPAGRRRSRQRRHRVRARGPGPDRRLRAGGVLGGEPDAARESRPARGQASARVRRDRRTPCVRGDAPRCGRHRPAVPPVRRPPLVHARRDRDARCAGRRPRRRGPHDDRERLGASAEAAAAGAAPVRPGDPPRPRRGRGPLAIRLQARVPDRVIVRLPNWLGDTVMAVPAIRALRQALEGAPLLLAGPWAAILGDQALADVLVTYPRSWSGRLSTADTVSDFGGSTAVLLPNSFEAAAAALYWGARRRIGFAVGGRSWLLTDRVELPRPRPHQVDEFALLVEPLGVAVDVREPRMAPPDAASPERRRVRALMREAGVPEPAGAARLVGVHLGAAYGSAKVWDPVRVVELCRLLGERGDTAVLLGAPGDVPLVEEVSRDTGVAHLAAALGTPVVALFGPTDPRLTAPRGPVAVIRGDAPCAPCFYRTCPIDHPCMRAIEATAVIERLDALLAERA